MARRKKRERGGSKEGGEQATSSFPSQSYGFLTSLMFNSTYGMKDRSRVPCAIVQRNGVKTFHSQSSFHTLCTLRQCI